MLALKMITMQILNSIEAISVVGTKAKLEVRGGKVKKVRRQPELEEQAALIECDLFPLFSTGVK
jgi:hypothetical protein